MVSFEELNAETVPAHQHPMAVDESVSFSSDDGIDEELEKVLLWASHELGSEQLIKAKEEFYWQTGKVFPDDRFYAGRMSYFIDTFLFEKPIENHEKFAGIAPFDAFENEATRSLQPLCHSVFTVIKKNRQKLQLKCLVSGDKFFVSARPDQRLDGIQKKDVLQCYIYRHHEINYLSKGVIFHPTRAYKVIRKYLKRALSATDFQISKALYKLARQQLRHCRHIHIDPRKFYQDERI